MTKPAFAHMRMRRLAHTDAQSDLDLRSSFLDLIFACSEAVTQTFGLRMRNLHV